MSSSSFSERLQAIIKYFNLDKASLANAGGVKPQTISGYLNDGRLPNQKTLELWVREFNLNGTWLLTGEGGMLKEDGNLEQGTLPDMTQKLMVVEKSMDKATKLAKLEAMKAVIEGEILSENDQKNQAEDKYIING